MQDRSALGRVMEVVRDLRLRCSWDRVQTRETLRPYLREQDPVLVAGTDGVYRCHTIFNCIDACPKGLDPTRAIETLRRMAQKRAHYEAERRERQKRLAEPTAPVAAPEAVTE